MNFIAKNAEYKCKKYNVVIGYLALGFIFCCLIVRCRYSFCQSDESFYLALTHRLWQGDRLIVDEWHPAQFYAIIIYPFYWLYRCVVPSGTGCYLFARIVYICLSGITSILLYFELQKRYAVKYAFWCAGIYLLYSRANIWGLSYYNLFVTFSLLAMICLFKALAEKEDRGKLYFIFCKIGAGFFSAFAVVCMPYLAIPIIIGSIFGICIRKFRKSFICYVLGLVVSALYYCVILFKEGSLYLRDIKNFAFILSDSEHSQSIAEKLSGIIKQIIDICTGGRAELKLLFIVLCILGVIVCGDSIIHLFRYHHRNTENIQVFILTIYTIILIVYAVVKCSLDKPGYPNIIITIYGIPFIVWMLLKHKLKKMPLMFMGIGLLLAIFFGMGSNTGADGMTTGFTLSAMGVCLGIADCMNIVQGKNMKRVSESLLIISGCVLFVITGSLRFLTVYRDGELSCLKYVIDRGPAAGLFTSEDHLEEYDAICEMIDFLQNNYPESKVFYTKLLPWAYVYSNSKMGAPTAWRMSLSSERLKEYYEMNSEKIPDIVVVFREDVGNYVSVGMKKRYEENPSPNKNKIDGYLWDYMQKEGFEKLEMEYADVYVRPS